MSRFLVAPQARRDLDRFKRYLLEKLGPEVALSELTKLEDAFGKLAEVPAWGTAGAI